MNVKSKVENKEQFSVELVIEIGAEEFEAGLEQAYRKNRGSISVPGFRKGKAPRRVIEGMYGSGTFYQDAIEELYPAACDAAIAAEKLDLVATPSVEIVEVGKEGLTFKAVCTVRPEVEVSGYKGIEADRVLPFVSEQMVDDEMKIYIDRASHLEPVDRAAVLGDTTVIDFEGFQNDLPFQGGKGENFDLVLGSHSFIPGFEEQLIGMSADQEGEIDVTFPEDYHSEDLKGKPAKFKVKVHEVKAKVIPELDDEFAKDVSEFETLAAFRDDLRAKVTERVKGQNEQRFRQEVLDKLAEKVEITLPDPMVEAQVERSMDEYRGRLEQQGISLEMFYQYMQSSEAMLRAEMRPAAEKQLRTQLALETVVRAENIQVSDEELTAEYQRLAEGIQMSVEELERAISRDTFRLDMARERAMNFVVDNAKVREISAEDLRLKIEEVKLDEKEEAPAKKPAKKAVPKKKAAEDGEAPKKPAAKKAKPAAEE